MPPVIKPELTTTVSVHQKVNIQNYESAEVFVSVSGITMHTTPDEIDDMLEQSKVAYSKLAGVMKAKVALLRSNRSHTEDEE